MTLRSTPTLLVTVAVLLFASRGGADTCRDDCVKMAALCAESQAAKCVEPGCADTGGVCAEIRSSCELKCGGDEPASGDAVVGVEPGTTGESAAATEAAPLAVEPLPSPAVERVETIAPAPVQPTILEKVAHLEADWRALRRAVVRNRTPRSTQLVLLQAFVDKHSYDNVYLQSARGLLAKLESGEPLDEDDFRSAVEETSGLTPEFYREKTEWFTFDLGVGAYGASSRMTVFTVRWEHFYWNIVRGSFTAGWGGVGGHAGTGFGIPIHLGGDGHRELRVGAGLEIGEMRLLGAYEESICRDDYVASYETYKQCIKGRLFSGVVPLLEMVYSWHARPRVGLEGGLTAYLFVPAFDFDGPFDFGNNIPNIFAFVGIAI